MSRLHLFFVGMAISVSLYAAATVFVFAKSL